MSHFCHIIIIPKEKFESNSEKNIDDYIFEQMLPFDENVEVDEYINTCGFCKGTGIHSINGHDEPCPYDCDENGQVKSTYNPKSKWDWYRVGGRYDGIILNKDIESNDDGFNFSDDHEQLCNNSIKIKEMKNINYEKEYYPDNIFQPYSILTPDGNWHSCGDMLWFGISSNDMKDEDWKNIITEIYEKYSDDYAVVLDCHI